MANELSTFKQVLNNIFIYFHNVYIERDSEIDSPTKCTIYLPIKENPDLKRFYSLLRKQYPHVITTWTECTCANEPKLHYKFFCAYA